MWQSAMVLPIAGQRMIEVSAWQRLIGREPIHHGHQLGVERLAVAA